MQAWASALRLFNEWLADLKADIANQLHGEPASGWWDED